MITLVTLYIARQAFMNQSEFNYFHVVLELTPTKQALVIIFQIHTAPYEWD